MPWPFIIGAAAIVGGIALHQNRRKSVFVSYCHPEELSYRNIFMAWDKHGGIDFKFALSSPRQAIPSSNKAEIRAGLLKHFQNADCLLVIVGPTTHASDWVRWEIQAAKKLGLPMIVVKLDRSCKAPRGLKGAGATWIYGFERDTIRDALRDV